MCGRFALEDDGAGVAQQFELIETPQLAPRYNIAPSQPVAAIGLNKDGNRALTHFQWGLIPSWSKDHKIGSKMINARSETAAEKPSFRAAFKRRRCIVPMSGFYEWQKLASGGKQPVFIQPEDDSFFAAAGLWEHWQSADGSEILTCTVLTTAPNELMAPIHNRMPVFLKADDIDLWLDKEAPLPAVQSLMVSYPAEHMQAHPVSTYVNNVRNEGAECMRPLG